MALILYPNSVILGSIVVSIPACHAGDQGSILCRGDFFLYLNNNFNNSERVY